MVEEAIVPVRALHLQEELQDRQVLNRQYGEKYDNKGKETKETLLTIEPLRRLRHRFRLHPDRQIPGKTQGDQRETNQKLNPIFKQKYGDKERRVHCVEQR